ncbi:MAG: hypothetical protein AAGD13_06355 [Pseudomonadota bacterium]
MRMILAAALTALISIPAVPAIAEDEGPFSAGSQAKGMGGVLGRETALFKAKVVDVLCELTGDCAEQCGDGTRQMALLREADGQMVYVSKNSQNFVGAAHELAPYCGQTVTVDGLLVGDPELTPSKMYMIQLITPEGATEAKKTRTWRKVWLENNPGMEADLKANKNRWFRIDPGIMGQIETTGWLGLGAEEDKKFIAENY